MNSFFFPSQTEQLFGIHRGPQNALRAWLLVPPFAEEEKSTRRVFTEIALLLAAKNQASLVFSLRGTGDSSGDFSKVSLADWRCDLRSAICALKERAPDAKIGLLGVRLGASLALLERDGADCLCLIEPILSGKSYLGQQFTRKKMRAQISGEGANLPENDLDGWPLGEALRHDLESLNLSEVAPFPGAAWIFGVGPKAQIAPPLQILAQSLRAQSDQVVMPAFWNLLDYQKPTALLEKLGGIGD